VTALEGTTRLLRLALRRDRVVVPVWIAAIAGVAAAIAASIVGLYSSAEERTAAAAFAAGNPIARVFDGPAAGTETGALVLMEGYWLLAVLTSLLCAQAVVRHTRVEEETGRAELVGAAVVGRHARLTAALALAGAAAVGAGLAVGAVLLASGLAVAGSVLAGASLAGTGAVFAGVAAVAAQVSASARAANGVAAGVLGMAFLLRAAGDAAGSIADSGVHVVSAWPSWLSPIGWGQQARAFDADRWWVLALFVATAGVLTAVAVRLSVHRDVGAGMLPPRPGPAVAAARLCSPLGLAWRLHRGTVTAWLFAMVVLGAAFGAVGDSADELVDVSDEMRAALEALAPDGGIVDLYFTFSVGILALAATGFTVQAVLRIRTEELVGHAEPLLATAVSRRQLLASHLAIVVGGTLALLTAMGTSGAVAYGALTGDWAVGVEGMLGTALAHAPASLALGSVVLLAVAARPRWAAAVGWGGLAVGFVLGQLGAILELPQPVLNLSPFTHVPAVPAQPLELLPLVLLSAVATLATAAAFVVHRRRDLVLTV
jgi:ABC-2 type transport system permease protein